MDGKGGPIRSERTLARIAALVLPPAWRHVWICPEPNGHLQATGIDARGRKQYRYHAEWTTHRNLSKFDSLAAFARVLPRIRRRVRADMALAGMPRDRVLACIVHLLDSAHIRIGNAEYARDNRSYGLTTLHNSHAEVHGGDIRFRFRAKSGKACDVRLHDPASAAIVRKCQCLPGQELFAYVDQRGRARDVSSSDVNEYLHRISGLRITAKDFRTWGGTTVAAETLLGGAGRKIEEGELNEVVVKRAELVAIRAAAAALCNTVATCRKFYVHPALIGQYADGTLGRAFEQVRTMRTPRDLRVVERAVALMITRPRAVRANIQRAAA